MKATKHAKQAKKARTLELKNNANVNRQRKRMERKCNRKHFDITMLFNRRGKERKKEIVEY